MDITITISDKAEQNIREKAEENDKAVEDFVEEFLEKSFDKFEEGSKERKHNLLEFAGMFKSDRSDTSERMHELLREHDFDPAEGFSIK